MARSAFFFAAGIWIVQQFPQLPDDWHWLASACVLIGILLRLKFRKSATFLFGMLWAIVYASIALSNRLPIDLESKIIPIQGRITGLPSLSDRRVRFNLTDIQGPEGIPKKLRLSWYNPKHEIKAGQYWSFSVKLKRPHGNLNPGGFDYERWLLSEGIGATGYVRERPSPVIVSDKSSFFTISTWRQQLSEKLNNAGVSSDTIGIIKALAIGDRQELSSAQWNIFRNTGTVHLIAISGLHIGLISGLIYLTVVKFWARTGVLRRSPHHVGALAALFIAALYAGLAGFSVPTQRALIMLAAVMFSVIWQRNVSLSNTLALALLAVLAMDPLAILSPGFWLSFLAVIFIVFIAGGRLQKTNRWLAALKIHWAMALALAPVLLFFFQQTSLIAPLANLIAVPVVSFLVVPILLPSMFLLGPIPELAEPLLLAVDTILKGLFWFLVELADWPFAILSYPQPTLIAVIFFVLGVFILLMPRGLTGRWLGCLMLCPLFFPSLNRPEDGEVKLTLLDVGQGLATVVQTAKHVLVFDTGIRFDSGSDSGTSVLLPFLRYQGIDRVDKLIVSHGDNDHIGGAATLLRGIRTDAVLSSVPERIDHVSVDFCRTGQSWLWDGVSFVMLAPGEEAVFRSSNDNSCVLKVVTEQGSILLTGDIEKNVEAWLIEKYAYDLLADILIVPHHGSKTSSTHAFLQAVSPSYALIPSGYKNRFGFPHQEVIERLDDLNINWFDTGRHGALTVTTTIHTLKLEAQRLVHRRYWHAVP